MSQPCKTLEMVHRALAHLRPYRDRGCKIVAERPVSSMRGYATCADAYWTEGHTLYVVDWKAGVPEPWHALQLVATAEAVECTLRREDPNSFLPLYDLAVVYLKHDPPAVDRVTESEQQALAQEWTHILAHYDWLTRNGIVRLLNRRSAAAETQGQDAGPVTPAIVLPPSTLFDPAGAGSDPSPLLPPSPDSAPPGLFSSITGVQP